MAEIICQICYEKGGLFGKKKIIMFNNKYVHTGCYKLLREKQFAQIIQNFNSEFEAMIEFKYSKLKKTKVRYFFGKDEHQIHSKDFFEYSNKNYLHMLIIPSTKQSSTKWIKKGDFDVGDNFESGYALRIVLTKNDAELRSGIINILQKYGFGCLPAAHTLHCHLNNNCPNDEEAKELLKRIVNDITKSV